MNGVLDTFDDLVSLTSDHIAAGVMNHRHSLKNEENIS
jgi:hypothetical protein